MNIENKYPVMIFRSTYDNKYYYKMGLCKKMQDGKYINGYIMCRFKNGVELEDKTKIYIKNAWLDFYIKDKETKPYVFVNEFETIEEVINASKNINTMSNSQIVQEVVNSDDPFKDFGVELYDDDLPF